MGGQAGISKSHGYRTLPFYRGGNWGQKEGVLGLRLHWEAEAGLKPEPSHYQAAVLLPSAHTKRSTGGILLRLAHVSWFSDTQGPGRLSDSGRVTQQSIVTQAFSTLVRVAKIEKIDNIAYWGYGGKDAYRLISSFNNYVLKGYSMPGDLTGNSQTWFLPQGAVLY